MDLTWCGNWAVTRVRMCWVIRWVSTWGWQMRDVSWLRATNHTYMGSRLERSCITLMTSLRAERSCTHPPTHDSQLSASAGMPTQCLGTATSLQQADLL